MIATSRETLLTSGNRELHAEVEQGIRPCHVLQFSSEIPFLSWDSLLTRTMHMMAAKLNEVKPFYDGQRITGNIYLVKSPEPMKY